MTAAGDIIELASLDGSNPLAFLAALGALRCLDLRARDAQPRLGWTGERRPLICLRGTYDVTSLVEILHGTIRELADDIAGFGDTIGVPVETYHAFAAPAAAEANLFTRLTFAAAYASDAIVDPKKGTVIPTALSFSNGQGGKLLLKDFRTLASRLTAERISAALFEPWRYDDRDEPTFRWDPLDMRTGAHMATDPGATETRSVMAANALAFVGLSFLPVVPTVYGLRTTAVRFIEGDACLTWPIWRHPLGTDTVAALLQRQEWPDALGIIGRFAARRVMFKKNLYLGDSFAI